MSNSNRIVASLALIVFLIFPAGSALAQAGASCTGNGQGTCGAGFSCVTTGEGYNTCLAIGSTGSGGGVNVSVVKRYSDGIIGLVNTVFVPVLFAVAFLVFLFGVFKYFILGAAEEKSRKEGRQFVLWGLIGFVVILSVWGLVAIVANTFGLTAGGGPPSYPTL